MMQQELSNVPLTQAALALDEFVEQSYERVQQMLTAGVPWREILTRLATAGENLAGHGASVSILILDENGLLRNGASPNLPQDYLQAIERLKPDAKVGTCAAAAATGLMVMTPDFFADDKWAELRHLPLALGSLGLGACRSHPQREKYSERSAPISETVVHLRQRRRKA